MYHALLPEQSTKTLKREYRVRFLVTFIFFVSVSIAVATVFIVPSYLQATIRSDEETQFVTANSAKTNNANNADIRDQLASAQSLSELFSSFMTPALSQIILRIADLRSSGIAINSIAISYTGSNTAHVVLNGTADNRDHLVAWRQVLQSDNHFSSVNVPISDLAPSSNLHFSLEMSASLLPIASTTKNQ
ncbi:MAG: hypothetical protein KGJ35_03710 [Patescibacteria group bacterium]|nr:hypothetical protein [Patescibacteria group bacterium]